MVRCVEPLNAPLPVKGRLGRPIAQKGDSEQDFEQTSGMEIQSSEWTLLTYRNLIGKIEALEEHGDGRPEKGKRKKKQYREYRDNGKERRNYYLGFRVSGRHCKWKDLNYRKLRSAQARPEREMPIVNPLTRKEMTSHSVLCGVRNAEAPPRSP